MYFLKFLVFPQEIAVETNCNHKNSVRLWWFIMAFYNVLYKVICYRDSSWLPVNFNIKPKHIKCIFPTNASYLQDRKKKIHSCWKCQHSTCWWKIYFILNILQYWMIKREKNRGIEFCIMSVQHTGNKINKERKPKLQFHLNKCLPCLPGMLGPHGWELVWWCWTPVNKYIQVSGQRRTAPTVCAGGCSRYVWKIDSCTINERAPQPAWSQQRVLTES